jgi:hypothetical protein
MSSRRQGSDLSYLKLSFGLADKAGVNASFEDNPQTATIQVPTGNGAKRSISCAFHGMDGRRLIVEAGEPLSLSTALSIEHEDNLFLGEVVVCAAQSPGVYKLEIKIEQILTGLHSLMALRSRLLGDAVPQSLTMVPVGMRN